MIVIGGLGSVHGAFLGAIFLITMPQLIAIFKDLLPAVVGQAPGLQGVVYGAVLVSISPVGDDTYETTLSLDRNSVQDLRMLYLTQIASRTTR
jgi:hypothetical protein